MSAPTSFVLSGGGARGAYEVGVLSYIFGDFVRRTGRVPELGVVSGSSVGAVNAAFLASVAHDPVAGLRRLTDICYQLEVSQVFAFGVKELTGLHRVWLGGGQPAGVFNAAPLAKLIGQDMSWLSLARNVRRGRVRALTVATTHVSTGDPHVFVDLCPKYASPDNVGRQVVMQNAHIRPEHVLASAAIPVVFPVVEVDGELHCDGGLRMNTPTAPSIHLGAEKLFVVGLSCDPAAKSTPSIATDRAPGVSFLAGKILDAFFLDGVDEDLHGIERINRYMAMGTRLYGPDFVERMNGEAERSGSPVRRPIPYAVVRPSVDLGRLAREYLSEQDKILGEGALMRTLLKLLDVGEAAEADLASFLLFDAKYARVLIELGRRDAAARHDELSDFFFGSPSWGDLA